MLHAQQLDQSDFVFQVVGGKQHRPARSLSSLYPPASRRFVTYSHRDHHSTKSTTGNHHPFRFTSYQKHLLLLTFQSLHTRKMADADSVPIKINLKLPQYVFQLQEEDLSSLHEEAKKALWEGIEKDGKPFASSFINSSHH
jgi:hypothetical protein